eukprot:evm.model.scf_1935.1 EVM.evm.TU.scf_1935.1   scf_1935:4725-5375(+)
MPSSVSWDRRGEESGGHGASPLGVVRGVATGIVWDDAPASICADGAVRIGESSMGGRRDRRAQCAANARAAPAMGIPVNGAVMGLCGEHARGTGDLSEGEVAGRFTGRGGPVMGPRGGCGDGSVDLSEAEVAGQLAGRDGPVFAPGDDEEPEVHFIATIEAYAPGLGAEPRSGLPRGSDGSRASGRGGVGSRAQARQSVEADMSLPLRHLLGLWGV